MRRLLPTVALLATFARPATGAPPTTTAAGEVVHTAARWRGDRIITEATLRLPDGTEIAVVQPGGAVDGIGMRVLPAPPLLRAGDVVEVEVDAPAPGRLPWLRGVRPLVAQALPPGLPPPDLGFVRTTNDFGTPLKWASGCVFVIYDAAGSSHIPGDQERALMDGVFARWRSDTDQCSYLVFDIEPPVAHETLFDRKNVIKFREDRWCRPALGGEPEECYHPDAAALTTLYFVEDTDSDRDGEILDADIEMNGVNFAISVDGESDGDATCQADLRATLTHEVGHLMGLDHTCWIGVGAQPLDDQGEPVPSCNSALLPPSITEATMYNFQECGETKKDSPEADDVNAVCTVYALADDPGTCEPVPPPKEGCCSAGGGPGRGGLLLALAVLLAATGRGRARTRAARGARGSARR